jgi:Ca-activated chloride channel family protein
MMPSFDAPFVLLAVPLLAGLFYVQQRRAARAAGGALFPSSALLESVPSGWRVRWRAVLLPLRFLALGVALLGLARPQLSWAVPETLSRQGDLVVALDVSSSMRETVFGQPKLEIAKSAIVDFFGQLRGERVGVVGFSGEVAVYSPLSADHRALGELVAGIQPGLLRGGTALGDGLAMSVDLLRPSTAASKVVIILTDGRSNAGRIKPLDAAQIARAFDVRVYAIGALAPTEGEQGIDERLMTAISDMTGGRYFHAADPQALQATYDAIAQLEQAHGNIEIQRIKSEPIDWPFAGASLALLALELLLGATLFRTAP